MTITKKIGYLFDRKIIVNPKLYDLEQSLYLSLLEVKLMTLAIKYFQEKKLYYFDATIGDRKCQTRASMIIDLFDYDKNIQHKLNEEIKSVRSLTESINTCLKNFYTYNQEQRTQLARNLNPLSQYFDEHNLNFIPSKELQFISLCLFTTLPEETLLSLTDNQISNRKIKILLNHSAKKLVCKLSIEHEQQLALTYSNNELQKALKQVESKGFCSMTACFPGIQVIIKKIKHKKQLILFKTVSFCTCYGIKNEYIQLLEPLDDSFKEIPISKNLQKAVIVVEGYKFPGSFSEFQTKFNIPQQNTRLPKTYYSSCTCQTNLQQEFINNHEESLLAYFAQHPQFTNNELDIDFKKLDLVNSQFEQDYQYFKSLSGYSFDDMSKFLVTHIYASKLQDALKTELAPPDKPFDI